MLMWWFLDQFISLCVMNIAKARSTKLTQKPAKENNQKPTNLLIDKNNQTIISKNRLVMEKYLFVCFSVGPHRRIK